MSLTLQDKKYIYNSINTSADKLRLEFRSDFKAFKKEIHGDFETFKKEIRSEFDVFRKEIRTDLETIKSDFQHYLGAYTELIRDDIRKIIEISSSKPDREEVREIAKEEIRFHINRPE